MSTPTRKRKSKSAKDDPRIVQPILVSLDKLQPAAYNPRETSPERLELLRLSIRKLGFILPLYATPTGHLLSGHQRLLSATLEGFKQVPVVYVDVGVNKVKNINVVFNRITNDMTPQDTSSELYKSIDKDGLFALAAQLPDLVPDSPEAFPCMTITPINPADCLQGDDRTYKQSSVAMCMKAMPLGIFMPAVVDDAGGIVNGLYRLQAAATLREEVWGGVVISEEKGKLARILTNYISMNFTLEKQYADTLRYGSFRRPNNLVENLVACMRFFADGYVTKTAEKSLEKPHQFWANFRRMHGKRVLDFGAGQCRNEKILSKKAIQCDSFEPYPVPWESEDESVDKSVPSLELARELSDSFLKLVANKTHWDSVFMNAVLNSVAFHKDRMVVLTIVHACCSFNTALFGTTTSINHLNTDHITSEFNEKGKAKKGRGVFSLEHEKGTVLGDINVMPKVQKFHTYEELDIMLRRFFNTVTVFKSSGAYWAYECRHPKRVNPATLKAALLHEFELPYANDQRINRGQEALAAFGKRLGIGFDKVDAVEV